jgi:16S rRNA (guanine527-N7)-methyltransferase
MDNLSHEFFKLSGIHLTQHQLTAFSRYAEELAEWNTRHSLTAIRNPEEVLVKHFLDSLTAYLALRGTSTNRLIDLGTGAGFPGLPIKILCPHIQLTLVESVGKKTAFCQHVVEILALENVEIYQTRAETLGQDLTHREQYDWALSRAVAVMPVLVEYLLPFVCIGGKALAMKGEDAIAETHSADLAIQLLGGHLKQMIPITLPGVVDMRHLVIIEKISATPQKYPRREGIPNKRPIRNKS